MKKSKFIKLFLFAISPIFVSCLSVQEYVEYVDFKNPPENIHYPKSMKSGKTMEFNYTCVDGLLSISVYYPWQDDFWLPRRKPEVNKNADLKTTIDFQWGNKETGAKISDVSAAIKVTDSTGTELIPERIEKGKSSYTWYFKKDSLPKEITVIYSANLIYDGEKKSFSYTAHLQQEKVPLWYLKFMNAMYF